MKEKKKEKILSKDKGGYEITNIYAIKYIEAFKTCIKRVINCVKMKQKPLYKYLNLDLAELKRLYKLV